MKMMKKLLTSAFVAAVLFTLSSIAVFAAEESGNDKVINRLSNEYTYTVEFFAGNHGTLDAAKLSCTNSEANIAGSGEVITVSNLKAGDQVSFQLGELVTVKDTTESSIYVAKGFRVNGLDSIVSGSEYTITVSEDAKYVVAYGIEASQVAYTVKYQDKAGKTLVKDDVLYGNIGEKPVVIYKRISGYVPTVVAFTKTLSDIAAENVFTFVYDSVPADKIDEVVTEETEYDYVTVGGGTVVVGGGTTGGTASNVTGGGAGGNAGVEGNAEADVSEGTGAETDVPVIDESQIVDLDDEETPLANIEVEAAEEENSSSAGVYTALGILAVIIAAVVAYIVSKKKKIQG